MFLLLSSMISIRIGIYDFDIIYDDFYQDLDLGFYYYLLLFISGSWFMILILSTRISIRILIYDFVIIYEDFYQDLDFGFCIIYNDFSHDLDLGFCYYLRWFLSGSWVRILVLSTMISVGILHYDFDIIYADFYQDLDLWFL